MLITKFNRMIHNKILWGIFGGIVIVSFVGFFTPSSQRSQPRSAAGKLGGKAVSDQEFKAAKFHTYLSVCMSMGRALNITPEIDAELRKETWQRLATLRAAEALGIQISDREVGMAIQRDPLFQVDGAFSQGKYDAFLQGFLAKLGVVPREFEEYIREQLIIQMAQNLVGTAVWMPPGELEETMRKYTDSFTVEYVVLKPDEMARNIEASVDDARAFYEARTNLFEIPERTSVKCVAFSIPSIERDVMVTTAAVTNYYDEHLEEFTVTDTNGNSEALDLADVRGDIEVTLAWEEADNRAKEKAASFVDQLVPDRAGKAPTFEKVAADFHLNIATTKLFSARERLTEPDVGYSFNKAAFDLRATPEDYFSDAISADDKIYILAFNNREDARVPPFEEVEKTALSLATRKARMEALRKQAGELLAALKKSVKGGQPFKDAVKAHKLPWQVTPPFTAYDAPEAFGTAELLSGVVSREKGEFTDPLVTEEGDVVLAYIANREAGEESNTGTVRSQILATLNRRQVRNLFKDWQDYLLRQARLEDTSLSNGVARSSAPIDDDGW